MGKFFFCFCLTGVILMHSIRFVYSDIDTCIHSHLVLHKTTLKNGNSHCNTRISLLFIRIFLPCHPPFPLLPCLNQLLLRPIAMNSCKSSATPNPEATPSRESMRRFEFPPVPWCARCYCCEGTAMSTKRMWKRVRGWRSIIHAEAWRDGR